MEKIDSCNRRDKDSYGDSIDDSPILKAPHLNTSCRYKRIGQA
jgi:hypothetical protein